MWVKLEKAALFAAVSDFEATLAIKSDAGRLWPPGEIQTWNIALSESTPTALTSPLQILDANAQNLVKV